MKSAPEMALDIETYGKLKRDGPPLHEGLCSPHLLALRWESWFIDCDHVPNELVVRSSRRSRRQAEGNLHNSLFDIPRLYRRFGCSSTRIHDTMIASRVARAGSGKRKFKVIQKAHSLEDCLERELASRYPRTLGSSGVVRSGGAPPVRHRRRSTPQGTLRGSPGGS